MKLQKYQSMWLGNQQSFPAALSSQKWTRVLATMMQHTTSKSNKNKDSEIKVRTKLPALTVSVPDGNQGIVEKDL